MGCHCLLHNNVPRIVKFIAPESTVVDARGRGLRWEWGVGQLLFNVDRVSVEECGKIRRWMMVRVAQHECT